MALLSRPVRPWPQYKAIVSVSGESAGRRVLSPKMALSVPLEWVLGPSTSPPTGHSPIQAAIVCHPHGRQQPPHRSPCLPPCRLCKPPLTPFHAVRCEPAACLLNAKAELVTSQPRPFSGSCCLSVQHHLVLSPSRRCFCAGSTSPGSSPSAWKAGQTPSRGPHRLMRSGRSVIPPGAPQTA